MTTARRARGRLEVINPNKKPDTFRVWIVFVDNSSALHDDVTVWEAGTHYFRMVDEENKTTVIPRERIHSAEVTIIPAA